MSWGERSCKRLGFCEFATPGNCDVDCPDYESNGREPDSKSKASIIAEFKNMASTTAVLASAITSLPDDLADKKSEQKAKEQLNQLNRRGVYISRKERRQMEEKAGIARGGRRAKLKSFRIARNKPCPCGSGKKFKHCCSKLRIKP